MSVGTLPPPVQALIRKDLREYRHHRMILLTAFGMPIVLMLVALLNLVALGHGDEQDAINLAIGQAMFAFFVTPLIVPAALAAYSVIGEKEQDTLEPVLSLPLTGRGFIHAKLIAIAGPASLVALAVFVAYYLLALATVHGAHRDEALAPTWAIGILGLAVPLTIYSTLVGMCISARARDLRVAEQLSGLIILPTMVPIALITFQVVPVTVLTWLVVAAIVLAVDAMLLAAAYKLFQRERLIAAV